MSENSARKIKWKENLSPLLTVGIMSLCISLEDAWASNSVEYVGIVNNSASIGTGTGNTNDDWTVTIGNGNTPTKWHKMVKQLLVWTAMPKLQSKLMPL